MAAISSSLVKWVRASTIKYFTDIASVNSIPMFVESVDERSDSTMRTNHTELRLQGPFIKHPSKDSWKVALIVNILFSRFMEMTGDAYKINEWAGIFMSAMDTPINVYKYGEESEDTGDFIGCLRVKTGRNDDVGFYDFGTALNDTRVHQAELDATFEMMTTLGE